MKRKITLVLCLEALLCAGYVLLGTALPSLFGTVITFPFKQIGLGLRALSLSGAVGNVIAIGLYILVCGAPLGLLFFKKHRHWEDALLPLLSVTLFPVMYLLINPHLQGVWLGQVYSLLGAELICLILWSILVGYGLMKVLHRCLEAEQPRLLDYLRWLILVYCGILVFTAFGNGLDGLLANIEAIRNANSGSHRGLVPTYCFLVVQYLVNILPHLLLCGVLLDAADLVDMLKGERFTEAVVLAAEKLSLKCARMLILVVLSNVCFNLIQILNIRYLRNSSAVIRMPLDTLLLVVALLVAARFIRSHKELRDENDSFI